MTKIILPQLGESVHEGTIGKWLKQVGDAVEEFEPLVEIITDKVNAEVPAPIKGTLGAILVKEGETVEVGAIIGEMLAVGAVATAAANNVAASSVLAEPGTIATTEVEAAFAPANSPVAKSLNQSVDLANDAAEASFPNGTSPGGWYEEEEEDDTFGGVSVPSAVVPGKKARYSPAVRRLIEEHHLDLEKLGLRGTGLGGRITRDDVQRYLEQQRRLQQPVPTRALPRIEEPATSMAPPPPMHEQIAANVLKASAPMPVLAIEPERSRLSVSSIAASAEPPVAPKPLAAPSPAPMVSTPAPAVAQSAASFSEMAVGNRDEMVPLTPMRRAIAEHMVRSVQTSPHAWTIVEVDMTRLVRHRAKIKEEFKRREGVDLTYLPFVIKAVVEGLRQFPNLNASWATDGSGVILKRDLNIGIAVDVPEGLVVPVLHGADEKSLVGLARSVNDLVTRARNRKLTMADVQGGTFTVNNPGAFGSVMSQPIINQPQAGIVTMEAIVKRPVVVTDADGNDSVVVRSMMNMCLSFDHRITDGATAGRFLQFLKKWLETHDYSQGF